jgi:hypothetical protein
MKRILTFLTLAFSLSTLAQQPAATVFQNWSIAKAGITLGGDIEMPHGLDYRYLLSTAENVNYDYSNLPFTDGTLTHMECDNPTARIMLAMTPPGMPNTEFQVALLSIDGRIDRVSYEIPASDPSRRQHLVVSAKNKESAIEGALLHRHRLSKSLVGYLGGGMNIGYSHGGEVRMKGFVLDNPAGLPEDAPLQGREIDLTYEQKGGINQRLFIRAGIGVKFLKRMEFGMDWGKGLGYRGSFGGPFNVTVLKRSLGLNLKYAFL